MAKIGFIGTGEISEAMIHSLGNEGHQIWVSRRSEVRSRELANLYSEITVSENQDVIDNADIVILGLMKNTAEQILPDLSFREDHRIISAMVDVSINNLHMYCSPATVITITIPLPFIATAPCPLPVFPDNGTVDEVFGNKNPILPVKSEKALNAHFAATSMASGLFAQMQTLTNWLGDVIEDQQSAETYVVSMLGGYTSSLPIDGNHRIQDALTSLSTEGGLNATMRQHLEDAGVQATIYEGLDSFRTRLGLDIN